MTYRPNPESLAGKVVSYFALHPDEALTLEDVIEKFVPPGDFRNVHTQLSPALDSDLLTWDRTAEVYRKGPNDLPSIIAGKPDPDEPEIRRPVAPPAPARPPAAPARNKTMPAPKKPQTPRINLLAVPLEDGIPIPEVGHEWQVFLQRFAVGQSAALPANHLVRLRSAVKIAKSAGRGSFVIRQEADGESIRIWRSE